MNSFTFTCSAPDGWFLFLAKTFGPGLLTATVTGSIAFAAFRVARSQREIANNKYNLDMFDKRYDLFGKIVTLHEKLELMEIPEYENHEYNEELHKKFSSFLDKITKFEVNQVAVMKDYLLKELETTFPEFEKSYRLFGEIKKDKIKNLKLYVVEFRKIKNKFLGSFDNLKDYSVRKTSDYINDIILKASDYYENERKNSALGLIDSIKKNPRIIDEYDKDGNKTTIDISEDIISGLNKSIDSFNAEKLTYRKKLLEYQKLMSKEFLLMKKIKLEVKEIHDIMDTNMNNINDIGYKETDFDKFIDRISNKLLSVFKKKPTEN